MNQERQFVLRASALVALVWVPWSLLEWRLGETGIALLIQLLGFLINGFVVAGVAGLVVRDHSRNLRPSEFLRLDARGDTASLFM